MGKLFYFEILRTLTGKLGNKIENVDYDNYSQYKKLVKRHPLYAIWGILVFPIGLRHEMDDFTSKTTSPRIEKHDLKIVQNFHA